MSRRRFRDIAVISGLVFQGFPGKPIKSKHLQSGSQLFYNVFKDYEPDNLLYQQAIEETFEHGMESGRMTKVFENIQPGDVESTYASTQNLEDWIGYRPLVTIKEGVNKFANWYLDYYQ